MGKLLSTLPCDVPLHHISRLGFVQVGMLQRCARGKKKCVFEYLVCAKKYVEGTCVVESQTVTTGYISFYPI